VRQQSFKKHSKGGIGRFSEYRIEVQIGVGVKKGRFPLKKTAF
jgi:hypothetical protein